MELSQVAVLLWLVLAVFSASWANYIPSQSRPRSSLISNSDDALLQRDSNRIYRGPTERPASTTEVSIENESGNEGNDTDSDEEGDVDFDNGQATNRSIIPYDRNPFYHYGHHHRRGCCHHGSRGSHSRHHGGHHRGHHGGRRSHHGGHHGAHNEGHLGEHNKGHHGEHNEGHHGEHNEDHHGQRNIGHHSEQNRGHHGHHRRRHHGGMHMMGYRPFQRYLARLREAILASLGRAENGGRLDFQWPNFHNIRDSNDDSVGSNALELQRWDEREERRGHHQQYPRPYWGQPRLEYDHWPEPAGPRWPLHMGPRPRIDRDGRRALESREIWPLWRDSERFPLRRPFRF